MYWTVKEIYILHILYMLSNASVDIVLMLITSRFKISDTQNQLSTFTIWQKIMFKVSSSL